MWIIGIDGGGTKCEGGLFTSNGELLATTITGPANFFSDFSGGIKAIEEASNSLLNSVNQQHNLSIGKQDCILSLGCAGGGIESAHESFKDWSHEYAHTLLSNDVEVSCLAANNAQPCALFVIGTGSCLAVRNAHGQTKQLGGHGFLLGDIGSGAWLGRNAVSWYLQSIETAATDSALHIALETTLGNNTSNIVQQYGQAKADKFGELVPLLLDIRHASFTVQNWLQEGALYAANLLKNHVPSNVPIFVSGGLSAAYKAQIESVTGLEIHSPKHTAIYGAYLQGRARLA
jgi:glucosamine kinase